MNKTVKKIAAVALSALMVGSVFAGCSSNSDKSDTTNKNTYNVGICQLTQHTALDSATKGFKDKLNELAKADGKTINFDYQNASNDYFSKRNTGASGCRYSNSCKQNSCSRHIRNRLRNSA